ncbi:MAG: rod shape-determining protein MreC [Kofleriaceae bacterium]|nr:rod shape-determining protein MreC [Kofleriaceae bacterium]
MAMTLRRRLVDWGLAALFLVLPALVLRASLRAPGEAGAVDEAVLRVSAPLQAGVSWLVDGVGGLWHGYLALVDVEDENRELRAENERLRRELAAMARRAFDVAALEEVAVLKRELPADTVGARVIAASLSPAFRVVRLRVDRGAGEVEPGMPVISSQGLVGRIQEAYGGHAEVLLTTDPRSAVEVVVQRTGGLGILRGTGSPDRYACRIEWLERGSDPAADVTVQVGDEIFTSGLGGAFPAGLKVGTVRAVSTKDYGMFQEVDVAPAVAFSRLRAVLVLLAPPPPPDPGGARRERSRPAHDVRPY